MMEAVTVTTNPAVDVRVFESQDDFDDFMSFSHEARVRSRYVTFCELETRDAAKLIEIALESGKPVYATMGEEE